MKNTILFLLTLFLTIGIALPSCDKEDDSGCNCAPIIGEFFRIADLELVNYATEGQPPQKRILASNEQVPFANYSLLLEIDPEFYGMNKQRQTHGFSLINSALACSCLYDGYNGAKEKIQKLTIVTKNDFSNGILANDTLNTYIEILDRQHGERETIESFVNRNDNLLQFHGFQLYLTTKPTLNPEFKVEISVLLNDGTIFSVENEPVIIQ